MGLIFDITNINNVLLDKDGEITELNELILDTTLVWSKCSVNYYVDDSIAHTQNYVYGQSILSPSFTPTHSGWTFIGWREDKIASSDVLLSKTMERSEINLYAVFEQTVTLSYNANGGSSTPSSQTGTRYYNNGNEVNPSFTLSNGISRSGYTFRAWSLNSATGTTYNADSKITLTENAIMYAVWYQSKTISGTAGGMNGTFQSGGSWEGTVSFGVTFASPPTVTTEVSGNGWWSNHNNGASATASKITTTNFYLVFNVYSNPGNNYNYGTFVNWTATGQVAV